MKKLLLLGDEIVEMNLRALKAGKDYSVART